MTSLALLGGPPVYPGPWPAWPTAGSRARPLLDAVLASGRWALSGPWTGTPTLEGEFSRTFADFLGIRHCLTVDHGSSALLAALLALDIGAGDEVIVPGLTWVACASAVLRVNATPVLVDVSADTLCVAPEAVAAAITPRTKALLAVHLYSAMADMDALAAVANRHGIPIIEDAAQAHGAVWAGKRAGTIGRIGAFSMQQGKVLTAGEGGAVVTDDDKLAARLEQLRADGRQYAADGLRLGHPHLREVGHVLGFNLALSEFQAAILIDGMDRLPAETIARARGADLLTRHLAQVAGLEPIRPHPANSLRAYYHYAVRYDAPTFGHCSVGTLCRALEAELSLPVTAPYVPLDSHPLLAPSLRDPRAPRTRRPAPLVEAHRQAGRTVLFHHPVLLASEEHLVAIALAFEKVQRHARLLSP